MNNHKLGLTALFFGTLFLASAQMAFAESVVLSTIGKSKINGLVWNKDEFQLQVTQKQNFAVLSGVLNKPKWSLIYQKIKIPLNQAGKFLVRMPIPRSPAQFSLDAVDPFGNIERETFKVEFEKTASEPEIRKSYAVSMGVGYSSLKFEQTNLATLTESVITPKAAFIYFLDKQWDIALSGYYSASVLSSSSAASQAQFLGINGRLGFYPSLGKSPFRLGLLMGFYYTTMMIKGDDFGFRNLSGPQLFPTLRYSISPKHAIATYFKFSPVSDNMALLSLSNNEIAFGLSYSFYMRNSKNISLSVDVATLTLQAATSTIKSSSTTFGLGFGF